MTLLWNVYFLIHSWIWEMLSPLPWCCLQRSLQRRAGVTAELFGNPSSCIARSPAACSWKCVFNLLQRCELVLLTFTAASEFWKLWGVLSLFSLWHSPLQYMIAVIPFPLLLSHGFLHCWSSALYFSRQHHKIDGMLLVWASLQQGQPDRSLWRAGKIKLGWDTHYAWWEELCSESTKGSGCGWCS